MAERLAEFGPAPAPLLRVSGIGTLLGLTIMLETGDIALRGLRAGIVSS